jgi:hypothetical protein
MYNLFSMILFGLSHFLMYRMFGTYALKMRIHHMCLRDFKESPTSKRVINNLPPMDIIKEGQGEDEDFDESSNDDESSLKDSSFSEKRLNNKLNDTEEFDDDTSNSRKAAKMSKIRRRKTK